MRENLLIMGVPHSGTSVITKMYEVLGWHFPGVTQQEQRDMEPALLNQICKSIGSPSRRLQKNPVNLSELRPFLKSLQEPWVIKDNKMCVVLSRLQKLILSTCECTLVWIQKDIGKVIASTRRRRSDDMSWWQRTPEQWWGCAERSFSEWPSKKRIVNYEDIVIACRNQDTESLALSLGVSGVNSEPAMMLFDPHRDDSPQHQGKSGWDYRNG